MKKPFSLTCFNCDAGDEFDRRRDATAAGWVDIQEDDGPSWNYLGNCPDCQLAEVEANAMCLIRGTFCWNDPSEAACQKRWPKQAREGRSRAKVFDRVLELGRELKKAEANVAKLQAWREKRRTVPLVEETVVYTPPEAPWDGDKG